MEICIQFRCTQSYFFLVFACLILWSLTAYTSQLTFSWSYYRCHSGRRVSYQMFSAVLDFTFSWSSLMTHVEYWCNIHMKVTVSCDVAPCSLVGVYRRFIDAFFLYHGDEEAASASETSVNFYQTAWCSITKDSHLNIHRRENLKSHLIFICIK
jgi:hypothetical protein